MWMVHPLISSISDWTKGHEVAGDVKRLGIWSLIQSQSQVDVIRSGCAEALSVQKCAWGIDDWKSS